MRDEEYRIYYYNNGHQLRLNNVLTVMAHSGGHTVVISVDETIEVPLGWIALQRKLYPATSDAAENSK